MHHNIASTMFDLPQPFGPTTAVIPSPKRNDVLSMNDLKPWISSRLIRTFRHPRPSCMAMQCNPDRTVPSRGTACKAKIPYRGIARPRWARNRANVQAFQANPSASSRPLLERTSSICAILVGVFLLSAAPVWAQNDSQLPGDVVLPGGMPTPAPGNGERPLEGPRLRVVSVVVIDPGHGGDDAGARATARDGADPAAALVEKNLTLAIARRVESAIVAQTGGRVLLTRTSDVRVGSAERAAFTNESRADLLVSIHLNGSPSPAARGFQVYYHDASGADDAPPPRADPAVPAPKRWPAAQRGVESDSARLAEIVRESLAAKLALPDRGVRRIPIATLEGATCPAILVEVGYLTNAEEALALSTAAVQDAFAEAIAEAVLRMDAVLAAGANE